MRILIIDDDDFKGGIAAKLLQGNEVVIAKSYQSGMKKIITEEWDGIILDMGFPQFDDGSDLESDKGLQVLAEMERREICIPVVVHSGSFFNTEKFENVIDYVLSGQMDHLRAAIELFKIF